MTSDSTGLGELAGAASRHGDAWVEGDWPARAIVGIVVPTFLRPAYLAECLESLRNSDLSGCVVCLVDESEAEPAPDPDGFTSLRGVDSPAHDLSNVQADISSLAEHARRENVVAFNEAGWLKRDLLPVELLNTSVGLGFRLFVRDEYLDDHPEYRDLGADPPPNRSDARTLVEEWSGPVPTLKIIKDVHEGVHDSLRIGWDTLREHTDCRYLCNLDADMVVKPGWISALLALHEALSGPDRHPLVCTGFNARNHAISEAGDGYCIKRTTGGANLFFDSQTYREIVRSNLRNVAWDWGLCEHMQRVQGTFAATSPSVAQHIGAVGMWSSPDSYDRADDY